jgi:hypothetical protein
MHCKIKAAAIAAALLFFITPIAPQVPYSYKMNTVKSKLNLSPVQRLVNQNLASAFLSKHIQ